MAIFKYKKPDITASSGYTIKEMPVINNTYTTYVTTGATDGAQTITLTPSLTVSSTGAGSFENVTASIKFLSQNPIYTPSTSAQTYTFASLYGNDGFPSAVIVDAIPTTTLNLTANNTTYNIGQGDWSVGAFPTSISVSVPSDLPAPTSPPSNKTISTQGGTIPISSGYYSQSFSITASFPNSSPSSQTLKPISSSYSIPTGYHATANRTVSVATSTLTLTNPAIALPNNTTSGTATITITPSSNGAWINTYYPSKITINFSNVNKANIVSGTSVCGINGTHTCSSSNIGENFFWLNAYLGSSAANTLAPAIYKWKDNLLNYPYFNRFSIEHDHLYNSGDQSNNILGLNISMGSTIYDRTTGQVRNSNTGFSFDSYADYMTHLGFSAEYLNTIPPYGLSFLMRGINTVQGCYPGISVSLGFDNGPSSISYYAFMGTSAEFIRIVVGDSANSLIGDQAFANSYARQLTFCLNSNAYLAISSGAFQNYKNSDDGYRGKFTKLVVILNNNSELSIGSSAFANNTAWGDEMHIYGSNVGTINISDAPWGDDNLTYTLH